jgi:hypothetical protein
LAAHEAGFPLRGRALRHYEARRLASAANEAEVAIGAELVREVLSTAGRSARQNTGLDLRLE